MQAFKKTMLVPLILVVLVFILQAVRYGTPGAGAPAPSEMSSANATTSGSVYMHMKSPVVKDAVTTSPAPSKKQLAGMSTSQIMTLYGRTATTSPAK